MNTPVKLWHLITIAAGVVGGVWLLKPMLHKPPPDFTNEGFTSVHVRLRQIGDEKQVVTASSEDPAVVAGLIETLRSGRSVVVCRCAALGALEFRRPDGTSEKLWLMPAHDSGSVEFRVPEKGRYKVDREWFLRVVKPIDIPTERWYSWPANDVAAN